MAVYSAARRGQHGRAAGRVRVGFKRKLPADQASIHRLDIAGWEVRVHEVADMGDERGALRRKLSGVTALLLTIPASPISSWGRDRKRAVSDKSVSVRVILGGRLIMKKKTKK